ncbi:hypothetical protein Tco_0132184 [Tanacetum coccineum]
MEEFVTKDRANYYSGITSITVDGKAAYELKGIFLDDLRENAFSGTNGKDAACCFPISLVRNASKWFKEFKASITTWVDLTDKFLAKYYPPSHTCNTVGTEAKRDPTNTMFQKWLASKFANYMMMDPFTRKVLWDFWKKGDNQEEVTNKGFPNLEEANNNDEHEIAEIFRIETNLFDYETLLCTKFNEFKYLLKVDTELFTHDIERTKTYEDYKNELNNEVDEPWSKKGVPYEICDHICEPFRFKMGKLNGPPAIRIKMDSVPVESYREWFENGRACNNNDNQEKEEQHKEGRCYLFDDPAREPPVCKIRRFEIIKYSFGQEEEYVAIKEYEYDDLTRTNEDACHAYQ